MRTTDSSRESAGFDPRRLVYLFVPDNFECRRRCLDVYPSVFRLSDLGRAGNLAQRTFGMVAGQHLMTKPWRLQIRLKSVFTWIQLHRNVTFMLLFINIVDVVVVVVVVVVGVQSFSSSRCPSVVINVIQQANDK